MDSAPYSEDVDLSEPAKGNDELQAEVDRLKDRVRELEGKLKEASEARKRRA